MLKLEAETRKTLGRPGSRFASIALKASVAPTLMAQGKTGFARQFLEEALELAKSVHGEGSGLAALPALPMAEMLYDCDNTGEAELLVEQYIPAVRHWGCVDALAAGSFVRARLAGLRGVVGSYLSGVGEAGWGRVVWGFNRHG